MEEQQARLVFAKNLKYFIESTGKTQAEICDELNISESKLSSWVTAKRYPRIDAVDMFAKYFKINRTDLVDNKKEDGNSIGKLIAICAKLSDSDIENLINIAERFAKNHT